MRYVNLVPPRSCRADSPLPSQARTPEPGSFVVHSGRVDFNPFPVIDFQLETDERAPVPSTTLRHTRFHLTTPTGELSPSHI